MDISQCLPSEVEELREVARASFWETYAPYNTEENMTSYIAEHFDRKRLLQELADPRIRFSLLRLDRRVIGYIKLNEGEAQTDVRDGESLEIERIYVLQQYQGSGGGRALMEHAVATAGELGKRYLWLGVWDQNRKAIGFYQSMGFAKAGEHLFLLGDEEQVDYMMKREL